MKCILIYFIPNIHIVGGFSCEKGKIPILIYFLSPGEALRIKEADMWDFHMDFLDSAGWCASE